MFISLIDSHIYRWIDFFERSNYNGYVWVESRMSENMWKWKRVEEEEGGSCAGNVDGKCIYQQICWVRETTLVGEVDITLSFILSSCSVGFENLRIYNILWDFNMQRNKQIWKYGHMEIQISTIKIISMGLALMFS